MILGFSLSPGGLLLPYHLGALASLSHHGHITESTPLAGSSAGALAVASHASGVPSHRALDASIRVSGRCRNPLFVANGGLLPSLQGEMDDLLPDKAHCILNDREGIVGLAHRQLFPRNRPVLKTRFETRKCLMDAVMDSSMFPFFLTNSPARAVMRRGEVVPRIVVDGVFAFPLQRIGCPNFSHAEVDVPASAATRHKKKQPAVTSTKSTHGRTNKIVDRTVTISVFPKELLALSAPQSEDRIGPNLEVNAIGQMSKLIRMATQASSSKELVALYESGLADAEKWALKEKQKSKVKQREVLKA